MKINKESILTAANELNSEFNKFDRTGRVSKSTISSKWRTLKENLFYLYKNERRVMREVQKLDKAITDLPSTPTVGDMNNLRGMLARIIDYTDSSSYAGATA